MLFGKYIVSLCIPRIHDATNHKFITALSKHLSERNCTLFLYATPSELYWNSIDEQGEKTVFELINYDVTDAVIIQDELIKDKDVIKEIIRRSKEHNIPVVIVGGTYEGCAGIKFDYRAGFEAIVRHVLVDHNIRNFHLIAGFKDNPFSEERIDVVRKVAGEIDVPFCDEDISYGDFWSVPTENAVEALFTRRRRLPKAIICINDTMAIATVNVLKRHGIEVPKDVIVTGFDGISEVNYCSPRITTCLCNSDQLASAVSDTAMELINGASVNELISVVPTLQLSESCGCNHQSIMNPTEELMYVNNSFNRFQSEEEHMFRMMPRILSCSSFQEIANVLDAYDFYDMIIALNADCLDATVNPLENVKGEPFDQFVKLIYNTDYPLRGRVEDIKTTDIHPNMEDIITRNEHPLIIYSLNYMGITMGYTIFNFHNYDIQNYYKTSQIVNTLNCSFGAYRTIQYQHYLSEKIEEMYRCDGLTHLLNRIALKNCYPDMLKKCSGRMTVVLADLDGLKSINDNHGHDEGDFAICAVAQALQNSCPDEAVCVRWGGDEMVAVIPGEISAEDIHDSIDNFIEGVNAVSGKAYHISASVGIKTFDASGSASFEDMVRATDQLMYGEKHRKKSGNHKRG